MKQTLILFLLFAPAFAWGQQDFVIEFSPLEVIDTLHSQSEIDSIEEKEYLFYLSEDEIDSSLFFANIPNQSYVLIKRINNIWILYWFNNGIGDTCHKIDNRFYAIPNNISRAGPEHFFGLRWFDLMDSDSMATGYIVTHYINEYYRSDSDTDEEQGYSEDDTWRSECSSEWYIENNILYVSGECDYEVYEEIEDSIGDYSERIISYGKRNNCECVASGEYHYKDGKFVRVKRYSERAQKFVPVLWVDKVTIGSNWYFTGDNYYFKHPVPVWAYGIDGEERGYEVTDGDKDTLFFVALDYRDSNTVAAIFVVSPQYVINGNLRTGMTVKEILRLYPNATLRIDTMSDWEYIFIDELRVYLFFKTTPQNRIGAYDFSDGEGIMKKVRNKKYKLDLIGIME